VAAPTPSPASQGPAAPPAGPRLAAPASAPAPAAAPPAAPAPAVPGPAAAGPPAAPPPQTEPPPLGRRRKRFYLALGVVALLASLVALLWYLVQSRLYVVTDNAYVHGWTIHVGGTAAGRVRAMRYDVGDRVERDAVVATLDLGTVREVPLSGRQQLDYSGTNLVDVLSPTSGVVVERKEDPGSTVAPGQALLTLVDLSEMWVTANVEEMQIRRVRVGQPADVYVDALDAHFEGSVVALTQASAASFSPVPLQNTTANFTKVAQLLPVKIALTRPDPRLSVGTSATVKIRVGN
jgi:multidrug resistance efflux pump